MLHKYGLILPVVISSRNAGKNKELLYVMILPKRTQATVQLNSRRVLPLAQATEKDQPQPMFQVSNLVRAHRHTKTTVTNTSSIYTFSFVLTPVSSDRSDPVYFMVAVLSESLSSL